MASMRVAAFSAALSLAVGSIAVAGVQVQIRDGRVSIVAKDATAAEILSEWAKVGQTTVVNGERAPRDRVTIELTDVSEEQALAVVLRRASGYVAVPRAVAVPDASRFDRILMMLPSVARPVANVRPQAQVVSPTPVTDVLPDQVAAYQTAEERAGADQAVSTKPPADPTPDPTPGRRPPADDTPTGPAPAFQIPAFQALMSGSPTLQPSTPQSAADQTLGDRRLQDPPAEPATARRTTAVDVPARPMASGQMTERRAAAPRDQAAVVAMPQTTELNIVTELNALDEVVPPPSIAGAVPAPSPSVQATFATRRAPETVDPRTVRFQLPTTAAAPPKGAVQPGSGAPTPGKTVPPPPPVVKSP